MWQPHPSDQSPDPDKAAVLVDVPDDPTGRSGKLLRNQGYIEKIPVSQPLLVWQRRHFDDRHRLRQQPRTRTLLVHHRRLSSPRQHHTNDRRHLPHDLLLRTALGHRYRPRPDDAAQRLESISSILAILNFRF